MEVSVGRACRKPKRLSITTSGSLLKGSGGIRPVCRLFFDNLVDLYVSHLGLWSLFGQLSHRLRPLMPTSVEAIPLVLHLDKGLKVNLGPEEPSLVSV
jgi:hypothetical protein